MADSQVDPSSSNGSGDKTSAPTPATGDRAILPIAARTQQRVVFRAWRMWARRSFTRDNIMSHLRSLVWVVPLTILIWIYAEREQRYVSPPVTISFAVTTSDPNYVATLIRPEQPLVTATISGPRAQTDAVIHELDTQRPGSTVRLVVDPKLGVGDHKISPDSIGGDPRFVDHVTVTEFHPESIEVRIDRVVIRQVEVRGDEKTLRTGTVSFQPSVVAVRGPQKVLDESIAAGKLYARADLSGRPEITAALSNPSDEPVTMKDVKVALSIDEKNISIEGQEPLKPITATLNLKAGKELVLRLVPVKMVAGLDVLNLYRPEFEQPSLFNVKVVGPEEDIDKLAKRVELSPSGTLSDVYATFLATQDDLPNDFKTREVEYKLPPNIAYKSGPKSISVRFVSR